MHRRALSATYPLTGSEAQNSRFIDNHSIYFVQTGMSVAHTNERVVAVTRFFTIFFKKIFYLKKNIYICQSEYVNKPIT